MATSTPVGGDVGIRGERIQEVAVPHGAAHDLVRQAYWLLYVGFVVAPIAAGLDKVQHWFTGRYLLGDWSAYLAPIFPQLLGVSAHAIMFAVGIIEVAAGVLVAWRPRWFAYLVAAWLLGIIVNLLLRGAFYDVALRDLGLMLGALALGRLALAVRS